MELKYPIKYAIIKMKEKNEVVATIVSKCYVVGKKTIYNYDGTQKILYEVVFPYKNKILPMYNIDAECINKDTVNQIFDNFEKAKNNRKQLNNEILYHQMSYLSFDEDYEEKIEKLKKSHQETLKKYLKLEKEIQDKTEDMIVTKNSITLEEIIERIIKNPNDFYIKVASILSIKEKEFLTQLIENRSCQNCTNEDCQKRYSDNMKDCKEWTNPVLIGRKRVIQKNL